MRNFATMYDKIKKKNSQLILAKYKIYILRVMARFFMP